MDREAFWQRTRDFFFRNLSFLVIAAMSGIYLVRGLVQVGMTGKGIEQIVVDSFVSFIFGYGTSVLMGAQGMQRGEATKTVQDTLKYHGRTVLAISDHINELEAWCGRKTDDALLVQRQRILALAGIKMDDFDNYFIHKQVPPELAVHKPDPDGGQLTQEQQRENWRALPRNKRKAIYRAMHKRITPLTVSALTTDAEGRTAHDPYYFGQTKAAHKSMQGVTKLTSRAMTALAFGYFTVSLATDWNVSKLVWEAIQIGSYILWGVVTLMMNYFWVTDTYRSRVVRKINILEAFASDEHITINKSEDVQNEQ